MIEALSPVHSPEEQELENKRTELALLEEELAQRELEATTLQAELRSFELRYSRRVGVLLAQLDEIAARIAEVFALLHAADPAAKQQAKQARSQANETTQAAGLARDEPEADDNFQPSEGLKQLYRNLARRVHPDLANDEEDRARRNHWMAQVNAAYRAGDEQRLRSILRDWEHSPDSVKGDGAGAELVRLIRKIARVRDRLRLITDELADLKASDLFQLKLRAEAAESVKRDLLGEMAARLKEQVAEKQEYLNQLLDNYHRRSRPA